MIPPVLPISMGMIMSSASTIQRGLARDDHQLLRKQGVKKHAQGLLGIYILDGSDLVDGVDDGDVMDTVDRPGQQLKIVYGFTMKASLGTAVQRNRARRRIQAALVDVLRENPEGLFPCKVVFVPVNLAAINNVDHKILKQKVKGVLPSVA